MAAILIVVLLAAILITLLGAWPAVFAFLHAIGWMYVFLALFLFVPAVIGVAFKLRREARQADEQAKRAALVARLEAPSRHTAKGPEEL